MMSVMGVTLERDDAIPSISHWSYPARPSEFVPKLAKTGEHRPKFLPSDVVEGGRYRWPKPDSIPRKALGPRSEDEYHRVHVVGPCRMRSSALGARPVL